MRNATHISFTKILFYSFIFSSLILPSQISMLTEFKAMPTFPLGAKEAFKASNVSSADGYYSYQGPGVATNAYNKKLQIDTKPFQEIILAKGKQGITPGMNAANDFSDLNSPETQAKIAKMTQDEKIKFAMEIQERMKNNKNVQTVTAASKPSPLMVLVIKISNSSQKLLSFLPEFTLAPFSGYGKCNNLCPVYDDPTCDARMRACEDKAAHAFYIPEVKRYNDFMKNIIAQFNLNKTAFENDLKEFDTQASKYPKDEVAADYMNVFSAISLFSLKLEDYEKKGATIIVDSKNNPYCKNDF